MFSLNNYSGLVFCLLYFVLICLLRAEPLAKVSQGLVQGTILKSRNGRNISGFIGIPYGQPPIRKLRFSSPLPAKKWDGIHLANKDGIMCPQPIEGTVIGNEDCLVLNVFTTRMKFNISTTESANLDYYGPLYLMDQDIVLVTINYRLGLLGFLSTGDSVAPGNFGLKDQVLALKWVQKNIQVFGGDKNRVTLFGESAGGASVTYHALSNSSRGLFHQYIIHSGNALVPWGYRDRSLFKKDVNYIARHIRCPTNKSQDLIDCFRKTDFHKLVNLTTYNVLDFPEILWIPTNEVESEDSFLTDSPQNLINKNKIRDYPFISGTVFDEGLYVTCPFYANSTSQTKLNVLGRCVNGTSNRFFKPEDLSNFNKAIQSYYFNGSVSSMNEVKLLKMFTKFAGDSQFIFPNWILLEKMAKIAKSPIYSYLFDYHGQTSYAEIDYDIKNNIGVNHADELLYIFSGVYSPLASRNDNYIIDLMVDLWTSFAINGKPSSEHLAIIDLWEPYQRSKSFLQIGNISNNTDPSVTLRQDYFTDRMNFWKENFPLLKL
ncbi:esterase FE4-like [Belonocnema kinseyi]|uniref:esterase FE4-like n=1 Tax=Belonocnema kinseyi TaxID=2817044 RepID=UPI00143D71ED|nr:esterase FE4-like [Belonocnema kinseyi]